ncbi:DUF2986 domain-containing protein [Thiomicrorhabdus sp. Kp2]|uniref:DUF2986 domain-containing protein n=1 Tax=Thiomicrorhabdus sp. Kp2 TaxID=1123518 RepID=UPI0004134C22|nr:DUF2986 domain-containing protein [Thiomicrorhabdus sp. Kp2]
MNRQKKIRQKFEKKLKQAKAKRFPKNKEPYIAKADREEVAEVVIESDNSQEEKDV